MTRWIALSALALLAIAAPAQALEVGEAAPAFTLPALTGTATYTTEGCRDKRAQLVIFWSSF
jgi:hypothetical protein